MIALTLCLAQTAEGWIEQLGSEHFREREAATARLAAIPEKSVLLAAAARSDDLEVAARARAILRLRSSRLLKGIGVVVGLNGTGDSVGRQETEQIRNILGRDIDSRGAALVSVWADLPRSQQAGTTIDVQVIAVGDATSLTGGTLFLTQLRLEKPVAEDPRVYGLAHGRIVCGEGTETMGVIKKGMIVE